MICHACFMHCVVDEMWVTENFWFSGLLPIERSWWQKPPRDRHLHQTELVKYCWNEIDDGFERVALVQSMPKNMKKLKIHASRQLQLYEQSRLHIPMLMQFIILVDLGDVINLPAITLTSSKVLVLPRLKSHSFLTVEDLPVTLCRALQCLHLMHSHTKSTELPSMLHSKNLKPRWPKRLQL
jgi:hypothetical protein